MTAGGPACRRLAEASEAPGRQPVASNSATVAPTAIGMMQGGRGMVRRRAVTMEALAGRGAEPSVEDRSPWVPVQKIAGFQEFGRFGDREAVVGLRGEP